MIYAADYEITSVENEEMNHIIGKLADMDLFYAENDEKAEEHAKRMEQDGTWYEGAGFCGLQLIYLAEIETEDFSSYKEKRVIIY